MTAYTGNPPTFTSGQKTGVAAGLNGLRDFARAFTDPWTAWTPVLSQTGTVAGTVTCGYIQAGKLIIAHYNSAVTGSGTAGTVIELTLPVNAKPGAGGGSFYHFDNGVAHYAGFAQIFSATKARFFKNGDGNAHGISTGTLSNGDTFNCLLTYEAA